MALDKETKDKLGGPMNLLLDPKTGTVQVLVVAFPDEGGNIQLRKDNEGNTQLSPGWMRHLIKLLPHDDQVAVISSVMARSIITGMSFVDRATGNLRIVRLEVDNTGSIQVLP